MKLILFQNIPTSKENVKNAEYKIWKFMAIVTGI
jgi:hypothetical protein